MNKNGWQRQLFVIFSGNEWLEENKLKEERSLCMADFLIEILFCPILVDRTLEDKQCCFVALRDFLKDIDTTVTNPQI